MHVRWERGGEANVLSLEVDAITLRSSVPAPPGARVKGVLDEIGNAQILVKVHGSKKQSDGSFLIEGRAIDMKRDLRVSIETTLEKPRETAKK